MIAETKPKSTSKRAGIGSGDGFGGRDGGDGGRFNRSPSPETGRLGMLLALAAITMFFVGLTSAYVVRQGLDPGWSAIRMPNLLLINTAVLLASSLTMEKARHALKPIRSAAVRREAVLLHTGAPDRWLAVTLLLGLVFLGGQLRAWWQLSGQGIYLGTNPHGSFFYLLTGSHGLHLLGGILALGYVTWRVGSLASLPQRARWVDLTALYWHFMDGLWIYLIVLLFGWR